MEKMNPSSTKPRNFRQVTGAQPAIRHSDLVQFHFDPLLVVQVVSARIQQPLGGKKHRESNKTSPC